MNDTEKSTPDLVQSNVKEPVQEITLDLGLEKEDKAVVRIDHETLSLNGDAYKIIENYREALDLEMLEARYSDFLEKYDFIVGDIAYEKLRLRGFYYSKNKKVPIDMRISSLQDYLTEYCSFGCAYFVLERNEPKKKQVNHSKQKNKLNQNKKNQQSNKKRNFNKYDQSKNKEKAHGKKRDQNKKSFTKKDRQDDSVSKQKSTQIETGKVKTVKNKMGETKFKIRQKSKTE